MFIVSTPGTLNIVFTDREDLENVYNHLKQYVEDKNEPDNAIRVYSISDTSYPVEKLTEICYYLKNRFAYNEGPKDII